HHHIETFRTEDESRSENINMILVPAHLGVMLRHQFQPLIPVWHADGDAIRLGGGGQMSLGSALRQIEGEFQDPVNSFSRKDRLLQDQFTFGAFKHLAADIRVLSFCIFTHHIEIYIALLPAGQGTWHPLHQPYRPQVHVLVEIPAKSEQRTPEGDVIRHHIRPPNSTEIDGVIRFERLEPVGWHHLAVPDVVVGACPVKMRAVKLNAKLACSSLKHPEPFRHHFLADAVPRNYRDPVYFHSSPVTTVANCPP